MKRFTDTLKWADPWHRMLNLKQKSLWSWLLDNCNCAGVLNRNLDWGLIEFQIGDKCDENDLKCFGEKLFISDSFIWITPFIYFQYGYFNENTLSTIHKGIINALNDVGIPLAKAFESLPKGLLTLKDKDKDKVKVKDKVKDELSLEPPEDDPVEEIFKAWNELGEPFPKIRAITEKRKKSVEARLNDKFFVDNWKNALEKIKASDFCKGKGDRGWIASFDWFTMPDSVIRTMEGKYEQREVLKKGQVGIIKNKYEMEKNNGW